MTGRDIEKVARPVATMGARVQEHGRIRFGVKAISRGGKEIPKAIKTWRFTSPDREAIASIAELYGGEVKAWHEEKANPQDQWEVITGASSIRALLPPAGLSINYELWAGSGIQRRCDGAECEATTYKTKGEGRDRVTTSATVEVPCLCNQNGYMECKPKTRLNVLLPEIRFAGFWRMETGSWAAADEFPAMENMLQVIQTYGVLEIRLVLHEQAKQGGSKRFVVPKIEFNETTQDLIDGMATIVGKSLGTGAPDRALDGAPGGLAALGRGSDEDWVVAAEAQALSGSPYPEPVVDQDEDVVDAEIVEDEPPTPIDKKVRAKMHALIGSTAKVLGVEADWLRHTMVGQITKGQATSSNDLSMEDVGRIIDYLEEVKGGERTIMVEGDIIKMPKVQR